MQKRALGNTGQKVSEIGMGTWTMSSMWGAADEPQSMRALALALELGVDFIDTAAVYGYGYSEKLIGKVLAEGDKDAFVATKVPPLNKGWPARPQTPVHEAFPFKHVIEQTEQSLKNLGRQCVDLQQLHVWHDNWLGEGDYLEAVQQLKSAGKIRFFGVSINDHAPETALKIVSSGLVDSVQVIYNIFATEAEDELFPLCKKMGVGVIVRVPFDEGSLAGGITLQTVFSQKDWRRFYFTPERLPELCTRIEKIKALLEPGESLAQLALRFCLANDAVTTVIPGMKSTAHVRDSLKIADKSGLSQAREAALRLQSWRRNFYPNWHG